MGMYAHSTLAAEKEIVWIKDVEQYPWVRYAYTDFCQVQGVSEERMKQLDRKDSRILIGYADLEEDADPTFIDDGVKYYDRRIFYINAGDYISYTTKNHYPGEALIPQTIEPKKKGLHPNFKYPLSVRLPMSMIVNLKKYTEKKKCTVTDVVSEAIINYIDESSVHKSPIDKRFSLLESRIDVVEKILNIN